MTPFRAKDLTAVANRLSPVYEDTYESSYEVVRDVAHGLVQALAEDGLRLVVVPSDREVLIETTELRDALDDDIRRAYCAPVRLPVEGEDPDAVNTLAAISIVADPGRMRHLASIQAAAWAVVLDALDLQEPDYTPRDRAGKIKPCPWCRGEGATRDSDGRLGADCPCSCHEKSGG